MATYTVTVTEAQNRVLKDEMVDAAGVQAWLDNMVQNKARRRIDEVLIRETDKRPDKMTVVEKEAEIDAMDEVKLPVRTR